MENLEFNYDEIFNEIISRMETQGSFAKDNWETLIDEILEEKQNDGILPDDFDFKEAHEKLEYMLAERFQDAEVEQ
ncbi:MAG: hypothetical protein WC497_06035 [Patescibacteria group bacterium]